MKDRFTHSSRFGRHAISGKDREEVYKRDNYTCQYCLSQFGVEKLSIDHLVPVALGGLHEIRNYVTCCRSCNSRKRHTPLPEFAKKVNIRIQDLPIHGDPIIDNTELPIAIRLIRKRIFDGIRFGTKEFKGKAAQQKIEKQFRMEVWTSNTGKTLEEKYPNLPGHVRIMLPEIETIATSEKDTVLLIELAKSASTRNLINKQVISGVSVAEFVRELLSKTKGASLQKRLQQALDRTESVLRKHGAYPRPSGK